MISLPTYGPDDERTLRSHLRLLHGLHVADEHSPDGLHACHQADHLESFGRPIRHRHRTEDVAPEGQPVEEWTW